MSFIWGIKKTMRIFVFEYITGGGMLDSPLPPSLVQEGDMMLKALVSDLAEIDGIEVLTTRDARLDSPDLPIDFYMLQNMNELPAVWLECMEQADAVWPIAPEFSNILLHISETVINQGKLLLNSRPQAVSTASSKLTTAACLTGRGVHVVPTYHFEESVPEHLGSWVLKPDDGVGCQGIRICRNRDELHRQFASLPVGRDFVVQPFVHGTSTSLNILVCDGEAHVLSVNQQRIAMTDNRFVLLGCEVNGHRQNRWRYHKLAQEVVSAIPDLWGIFGVDVIDNEKGLQVLEVNPRLTTSYVGLKESLGVNPAAMVLDVLAGKCPLQEQMSKSMVVDVNLEYVGAA
jgi:predicted ATP-grasp superfamily ATP-dependent carboligase